ncbi:MAG: class I SAM-dependent methyltransferase [Acidobacteriota bacterium]|nr:class I SAM-dependent methyltransferase [Acidobacteriota bacterium]
MKRFKAMNNQFEDIAEQLENHFDKRVEMYGAGLQSVDWKSTEAQYNRFRQLLKVVDRSKPFSINDYGCGCGELINLLKASNFDFDYFGFDVSSQMIEKAEEIYRAFDNCSFSTESRDLPVADYTIASGIFNLKFGADDERWKEYMLKTVHELNAVSRLGFSFNALTSYSDIEYQRADLYYADPLFWFDYCKRNISKRVSLLHDYPEYDFTIIVRKD